MWIQSVFMLFRLNVLLSIKLFQDKSHHIQKDVRSDKFKKNDEGAMSFSHKDRNICCESRLTF